MKEKKCCFSVLATTCKNISNGKNINKKKIPYTNKRFQLSR